MAEQFNIEKASEEVFEFVCGPCYTDGDVLQAKVYCSNCKDYLCDTCLKCHLRSKPSRHHILLDENSMPKDKEETTDKASDICTERCPNHSCNIIEYYCKFHDFFGCTKCIISDDHRRCEGVDCIEDVTANLYESQEYEMYEGNIKQISNDFSKISTVQHENDENIKMYSIRAKTEITSFRKNINEFLDRLETDMDKQISQMKESQTSKWISTSKKVEQLDNDIKTIKQTNEQTRNSGQRCNLYISMKKSVHQLKQLKDRIESMNTEIKLPEYIFIQDAELQNVLKYTKTFGTLVTSREDEAGYLGSTPSPTPRHSKAQNPTKTPAQRHDQTHTNTPAQSDTSALIDALTQRLNWYQQYSNYCGPYRDAIKSVKAGRRVDFDSLPTHFGLSPLPRALWGAYNTFHGY